MATVMNVNHFSIYLKRNMECTVILPSDIKNDEKLPVLWLYHGGSGDNTVWLYLNMLMRAGLQQYFQMCRIHALLI